MTSRRDFLATGGAALGALAVGPRLLEAVPAPPRLPALYTDAATRELMMEALDAAKRAGASWADVRISRNRNNSVQTREKQVTDVVDADTMGCGVRVLVDGCWGFAATQELSKTGVGLAAQEAVAIAKANRLARDRRVELAPAPAQVDKTWRSAYTIDPFTIAIEEKADLLLRANAAALTVPTVRFVNSGLSFVKEERNYANTDGTVTTQDYVRSWVTMSCTAVAPDRSGTAVRGPEVVQPAGRGWEYVLEADIVTNARVWAA
ncbi:PmbA/TldA family metallopeptidase, partial [Gemmatimonas sp.]